MNIKGAMMQDAEALLEIKDRVASRGEACIAVVAAPQGVIPRLREMCRRSLERGRGFEEELAALKAEHEMLAAQVLPEEEREGFRDEAGRCWEEMYEVLCHAAVLKGDAQRMEEYVLGRGDVPASLLVKRMLGSGCWRDARDFMVVEEGSGEEVGILWEESCGRAEKLFRGLEGTVVVPGGCGRTRVGDTVALDAAGMQPVVSLLRSVFRR